MIVPMPTIKWKTNPIYSCADSSLMLIKIMLVLTLDAPKQGPTLIIFRDNTLSVFFSTTYEAKYVHLILALKEIIWSYVCYVKLRFVCRYNRKYQMILGIVLFVCSFYFDNLYFNFYILFKSMFSLWKDLANYNWKVEQETCPFIGQLLRDLVFEFLYSCRG